MNCDDIVYIVKVQPLDYSDWNLTTVGKYQCFCGKLKNQIYNIVCIETGDRFETTEATGKYFHVDPSALCKHLNHPETYKSCGKHPETKQKLHWKRLTTGE